MNSSSQPNKIYYILFATATGLLVTATGGGLFGQESIWLNQWQYKLFDGLCHQDTARSFWIGSSPMAVCSRCYGIYAGFAAGVWAMPLYFRSLKPIKFNILLFITLTFLFANLGDALGNIMGMWQNTLWSRAILGGLLGTGSATLLTPVLDPFSKSTNYYYQEAITYGKL